MTRVAVVGGGVGGAAAALRLAEAGAEVVLIERSEHLGGLLMSLEIGGTPLERFYHHIFPHEYQVIALIDEMGLSSKLQWMRSSVGMLFENRIWPFVSPVDLLRFQPLDFADRIHAGVGAVRSMRWKDWVHLDRVPARAWLTQLIGARSYEVIWAPLLRAKFGSAADTVPAAWMFGRVQQRAAARKGGVERLGYLRGGFRQMFDALELELPRRGVKVQLATAATRILLADGRTAGVETDAGVVEADAVLYAGTLPGLPGLVPAEVRDPRWSQIGAIGAMAVVVELRRKVTDTYWVNIGDPSLPLTAYIEHTNFVPASDYGGRHLAYMARYFTSDDPVATADINGETTRWIDALADGGLPGFRCDDVVAVHPARTPYAAPLVQVGYLDRIPPVRSHIPGLYVTTTAQIYPQDRGMSDGIRLSTEAVHHLLSDAPARRLSSRRVEQVWSCPVCTGSDYTTRYRVPADATEGGVNAEAFRPSSERFGQASGRVVTCSRCGHGTLENPPPEGRVSEAYTDAADPVSLREEDGQVATGLRAFDRVERFVSPGKFADIGCWTGSLLVAAAERGWEAVGLEPSTWASTRARERGLEVATSTLKNHRLEPGSFRCVALCDVLEHLEDPGWAVETVHHLLEPGGVLYLTVPDAGSALARAMGRRWWSVLPMHLQYFTRASMRRLLNAHGYQVVSERTHAKVFTARYYAERLGGYDPRVARLAVGALRAVGLSDKLVAPNFGDRLEVVARSR